MPYSYEQDTGPHMNVTIPSPATPMQEPRHTIDSTGENSETSFPSVNKWIILALAASSSFMTTLDGSIINIGLPTISHTFHTGISGSTEWIIIGYLVIIAATLLTFGRLADILGRKPIFLAGLVIFVLGSALCGLAPSLLFLIIARLFQGIGGALIFSVNIASSSWCTTLNT